MIEYSVGDRIWFDYYQGYVVIGEIVDIKHRIFRKPKYRVMYGVGLFGVKTSNGCEWIKHKNIVKLAPKQNGEEKHE